jgi:hypothetical protein
MSRLPANPAVRFETVGDKTELVLSTLDKLEEPPSLLALREAVTARLPRIDLPEVLLEVAARTKFTDAFTHITERSAHAAGLATSLCAVLLAEACNTGPEPLIRNDDPALKRERLSWVNQNYVRDDTLVAANACLVAAQNKVALAHAWGGGEVASADGMRFVVPVRTVHAGYNPKYFGAMPRPAGSLKLGRVPAIGIMRMLRVGDRPTRLAQALAEFGRIEKTLHMLNYIDDESRRRAILTQLNRGEGRHSLARAVFHGKRGELRQRYREGQEDQLGALGLVVNIIILWNTIYTNAALEQLRKEGFLVRDEDVARLSPLVYDHINLLGRYLFTVHEGVARGELRPLRNPGEEA